MQRREFIMLVGGATAAYACGMLTSLSRRGRRCGYVTSLAHPTGNANAAVRSSTTFAIHANNNSMEVRSDPIESAKSHFFDTSSWSEFCDVTLTLKQGHQRDSGGWVKIDDYNALTQVDCPDRRIDRLCITCCSPSQPSHHTECRPRGGNRYPRIGSDVSRRPRNRRRNS